MNDLSVVILCDVYVGGHKENGLAANYRFGGSTIIDRLLAQIQTVFSPDQIIIVTTTHFPLSKNDCVDWVIVKDNIAGGPDALAAGLTACKNKSVILFAGSIICNDQTLNFPTDKNAFIACERNGGPFHLAALEHQGEVLGLNLYPSKEESTKRWSGIAVLQAGAVKTLIDLCENDHNFYLLPQELLNLLIDQVPFQLVQSNQAYSFIVSRCEDRCAAFKCLQVKRSRRKALS